MKKFFEDFKAFAMRGNVIDMAVGVIIGAAFGSITTSLVNDIFMPLIGVLTGGINFGGLFIALDGGSYVSAEAAAAAGVSPCFVTAGTPPPPMILRRWCRCIIRSALTCSPSSSGRKTAAAGGI